MFEAISLVQIKSQMTNVTNQKVSIVVNKILIVKWSRQRLNYFTIKPIFLTENIW